MSSNKTLFQLGLMWVICDVTPDRPVVNLLPFCRQGHWGHLFTNKWTSPSTLKTAQASPLHSTGGEQNNSSSAGCHSLVRLGLTAANHERNLVVWWYKFHCPRDVATKITPPCPCDVAGSSPPADQLTIAARCVPKVMRPCLSLNLFLQNYIRLGRHRR